MSNLGVTAPSVQGRVEQGAVILRAHTWEQRKYKRASSMVAWLRVVVPSLCMLYCSGFISASSTCNATSANANRDAGKCAVAKCRGDSSYPIVCNRVSRYTLVLNGSLCCEKMCHLEYPNGSSCLPRTAIPGVTDTGDATAADTRLLLLFIAVVAMLMNRA